MKSFCHKVPLHAVGKQVAAGFPPSPSSGERAGERWHFCSIHKSSAFTLIELLTVIAIIGILLTLGIPMIKGMNKSNSMVAANRQLLDDINYARQRAISDHTSVYIVFIPPTIYNWTPPSDPGVGRVVSNLYGGQYTTYALLSLRSIGEQPGRATPHYLTTWRTLPAGVYIATNKFFDMTGQGYAPPFFISSRPEFPFPVATNFASAKNDFALPHFGFNYLGQLICRLYTNNQNMDIPVSSLPGSQNQMYIPLVRGSIFYQNNPDGTIVASPPDVGETQPGNAYYAGYNSTNALGNVALPDPYGSNNYNQIYVDPLTGRAKVAAPPDTMKVKLHSVVSGRTARSLAAFTMIEIALALGVIGFALVAIIGVLPAGMSVQKDNRESTLVNFDANFLLNAITTGSTGLNDLTNHIIAITNYLTLYNSHGEVTDHETIAYTTTNTYLNGSVVGTPYLTNGQNIIALLTTPKYIPYGPYGSYYSNFATADFRAFSSSLADQGTSESAQSFAFAYRIFPEVIPYYVANGTALNGNPNGDLVAANFQNNFTQIRLRFRWPIFPNGGVGNSRLTFRTAVSGAVNYMPEFPGIASGITSNALFQPGTYVGQ